MTKRTISNAISSISTRHIEEAAYYFTKKKSRKLILTKLGALAACLLLVVGVFQFFVE